MIWALELFVSVLFGFELSTFFIRIYLDPLHRFFVAVPLGFFTLAWILFISSSRSQLCRRDAQIAFSILLPLIFVFRRLNSKIKISHKVRLSHLQFFTYLIAGGFFVLLMYLSMLNRNIESRGAGYGDLPFHLNIASSFSNGCNNNRSSLYDVHSAFFAGEKLAYPMITNFLTGALVATGQATLRAALFFPSALMICSLMVGQFSVALEFTKNPLCATMCVVLFVNLGGLGWIRLVDPKHGYGDWVHNWGRDQFEYWFHPLMHILVPQRASLWSMPLCYWTLLLLIYGVENREWRLFIVAGILTGFTPLVQVHSFVALAQWSIAFCLVKFPFRGGFAQISQYIGRWALFGFIANCLALPQFYPYFNRLGTARSQFLQVNPIWRTPEKRHLRWPALVLWWRGLGAFWAMSMLGIAALSARQLGLYVPSLAVYAITNIIRYQPWELDNTKLFYAAWIPMALPVVANFLYRVGRRRLLLFGVSVALMIVSCLSAFIHTADCMASRSPIFDLHDFSFGHWVSENTATKAVFLTSSWHSHPAATIAGRQLFMGYGGWVASHGLDYWGRSSEQGKLTNDPGMIKAFEKHGIKYAISRHHEFSKFESADSAIWRRIYEDDSYLVWKLVREK
jgi:hypothetical protein